MICRRTPDACAAVLRGAFARDAVLLRPGRDRGRSLYHRPLVVAGSLDAEAVGRGALPGRAEAILGELPGAFALHAPGLRNRLARHLAVGGEYHLEFDIRRRPPGGGHTGETD